VVVRGRERWVLDKRRRERRYSARMLREAIVDAEREGKVVI
jgi:hypothetical protein